MEFSSLDLNQLQAAKYEYLNEHLCDWSVNPRPFSTLAVMETGSGRFSTSDGKTITVTAGETFFIPASSKYKSYWYNAGQITYYAIHFHFSNWYSEFSPQRYPLQKISGLSGDAFLRNFKMVCKYASLSGCGCLKAYGAFYNFYSDVLPMLCADSHPGISEFIRDAINYVEQNYEKDFSVNDLAQMSHLSESRLYVIFHQSVGCSPIAYRNSVRIRKAMTFLSGPDTLDDISAKVGFSSPVYFRRVFRQVMGKLPSDYRKMLHFRIPEKDHIAMDSLRIPADLNTVFGNT